MSNINYSAMLGKSIVGVGKFIDIVDEISDAENEHSPLSDGHGLNLEVHLKSTRMLLR